MLPLQGGKKLANGIEATFVGTLAIDRFEKRARAKGSDTRSRSARHRPGRPDVDPRRPSDFSVVLLGNASPRSPAERQPGPPLGRERGDKMHS
jgi:hypothetical protein